MNGFKLSLKNFYILLFLNNSQNEKYYVSYCYHNESLQVLVLLLIISLWIIMQVITDDDVLFCFFYWGESYVFHISQCNVIDTT